MNNEFIKDISRGISKEGHIGEIPPGTVGRRYEPSGGLQNHNKKIHRENRKTDYSNDLPFTFSKPKKPKRPAIKVCVNCNAEVFVNKDTVGIICSNCHTFSKVKETNVEEE